MQRRKAVIARTSVLDMRVGLNPRIAGGGQARSTLFVSIIPRTHHQHTPFDATLFLGSSKAPCHIYTFSMFSNRLVTVLLGKRQLLKMEGVISTNLEVWFSCAMRVCVIPTIQSILLLRSSSSSSSVGCAKSTSSVWTLEIIMDNQAKGKEAYLLFHPVAKLEICSNIRTICLDKKNTVMYC